VIAEQLETGSLVEIPVPLPKLVRTLWCIHHRQKHLSSSAAFSALLRNSGGASLTGEGKLCFTYNPGRVMKLSYN
jgi:hypothetical protein